MAQEHLLHYLEELGQVHAHRLPSERELCETLKINRETLRRTLSFLRLEGRIVSRIGSGHYAENHKLDKNMTDLLSFTQWIRSKGFEPASRILRQGSFESPKQVSKFLQVPLGTRLFYVVRLRLAGKAPLLLEYAYLNEEAYPDISSRDFQTQSLYEVLKKDYGADLHGGHETISVTYVDAWEARYLEVPAESAAFFVRSTVVDREGTPLEYCKSVIRRDKVRFLYSKEKL